MKVSLLRLALLATVMMPAASVLAADLDPPPPVDDLRPATYDWTGGYVGVIGSVTSLVGHYDKVPDVGNPVDPEMSGTGFMGGVVAGYNWQVDNFVLGIEGDYQIGTEIASNDDPAELTDMTFNGLATARVRGGVVLDQTMFYLTGGVALIDTEFGGEVGPAGAGAHDSQSAWVTGYAVGGGMEHAFTDSLHGRLEYMYIGASDASYRLEDPNGFGGDVDMHFQGIHQIRAGLTYNFML
jgi:outer membrane immunogenic protein